MSYKVQSIIFSKKKYTPGDCVIWLIEHGFNHRDFDEVVSKNTTNLWETSTSYRYRQINPKVLQRQGYYFITKHITKHIFYIIAYKN